MQVASTLLKENIKMKIETTGLLPWDKYWLLRRRKTDMNALPQKERMNCKCFFMQQDNDWARNDSTLQDNLLYQFISI